MKPASHPQSKKPEVAIIGLGNWGTSLAAALAQARIPLREVVVHRRRRTSPYPTVSWKHAALTARILWLCVPDSAIAGVAQRIVAQRSNLEGQILVHSSGALTIDALAPARRAGAAIASIHPAMSFPTREIVPLVDILFAVETDSPATQRILHAVVRKLGGRPFDIASKDKALYHAAGTLASPLLVSALSAATETARLAGLNRKTATEWVNALARATLNNFFGQGAARSFSGPFARGDSATIHLHLQALQQHPILADLYKSLAVNALKSLPVRNEQALRDVLTEFTASKPVHR
jgi:predicted short-subunit dehydrogenase-like oxidoreductase (DUF2520 family)